MYSRQFDANSASDSTTISSAPSSSGAGGGRRVAGDAADGLGGQDAGSEHDPLPPLHCAAPAAIDLKMLRVGHKMPSRHYEVCWCL